MCFKASRKHSSFGFNQPKKGNHCKIGKSCKFQLDRKSKEIRNYAIRFLLFTLLFFIPIEMLFRSIDPELNILPPFLVLCGCYLSGLLIACVKKRRIEEYSKIQIDLLKSVKSCYTCKNLYTLEDKPNIKGCSCFRNGVSIQVGYDEFVTIKGRLTVLEKDIQIAGFNFCDGKDYFPSEKNAPQNDEEKPVNRNP